MRPRISSHDAELRGHAAQQLYGGRRQPGALKHQRSSVLFERADGCAIGGSERALRLVQAIGGIADGLVIDVEDGSKPPREGVGTAKVLWRDQPFLRLA